MKRLVIFIIALLLIPVAFALEIEDDFECNGFGCGTGWTGGWATSGGCEIVTLANPIDAYHLRGVSGCDATRYFDASHSSFVNVSFYATATSLESGDYCRYYYFDGISNHELLALTNGDDDGTHDYYEYDVTSYGMADDSGIRVYGALATGGTAFMRMPQAVSVTTSASVGSYNLAGIVFTGTDEEGFFIFERTEYFSAQLNGRITDRYGMISDACFRPNAFGHKKGAMQ